MNLVRIKADREKKSSRRLSYHTLTVVILFISFIHLPASSLFSQTLNIKAIPYPCTLLDSSKNPEILSDSAIIMLAGKGTDLHHSASGKYSKTNAPKILFTPDSNFTFSAKVKPGYNNLYDGGAILVWTDESNWTKILIQNLGEKSIIGMSVVKDKITDDSYFNIAPVREVFLKLSKHGKVFCFYTSNNRTEWILCRQFVYHKIADFKIGFYSQSPKGPDCKVEYSGITYIKTN